METSYKYKPYSFIPFTTKKTLNDSVSHRDLLKVDTYMGKLDITIKCMTPLHFGSGQIRQNEDLNYFVHTLLRENGNIALPGSSFKGMLRSVFEAITRSCVLNYPLALKDKIGNRKKCTGNYGQCPACSVFGRLSNKGKLIISSFRTEAEPIEIAIPSLEQPFKTYPRPSKDNYNLSMKNSSTGNERLYYGDFSDLHQLDVANMSKADFWAKKEKEKKSGGDFYGRKFYKHSGRWNELTKSEKNEKYECLPVGTLLYGTISYQGLSEDELGALLFALGLGWGVPIYHKLGYAKPAFLGSVELTVAQKTLSRYDNNMTTSIEEMASCYYKKYKKDIASSVDALKEIWSEIGEAIWPMQNGKYGY